MYLGWFLLAYWKDVMGVMRRLLGLFGGVVAVLSLLGGCAEGSDPSVTLSLAQERLYQQAFEVYEKYFEILNDLRQQCGAEELPDEIKPYLMGVELDSLEETMHNAWESNLYYTGEISSIIEKWGRGSDPEHGTPAFMSIAVCEQYDRPDLMNGDGTLRVAARNANVLVNVQFAKDTDGSVKVYSVDTKVVTKCEL
jgi:hypothetical protein